MNLSRRAAMILITAAVGSSAALPKAEAAVFTWLSSPGTSAFDTAANWTPAGFTSAATTDLVFATSNTTSLTNSTTDFKFNSITFNSGASSYTLAGSNLRFQSTNATITQSATNAQTISMGLEGEAGTLTLTGDGTGLVTISGAIVNKNGGNIASVTKAGTSTYVLSGANTYTGNTAINDGILRFANSGALPDGGTITVASGGIMGLDGNFTASIASGSTGIMALNSTNSNITGTSASSVFLGSLGNFALTSASLSAGASSTYRFGGGGGTLSIGTNNIVTGANNVIVGSNQTNSAGTLVGNGAVVLTNTQNFTGNLTVNVGPLFVNAVLNGGGSGIGNVVVAPTHASTNAVLSGNSTITLAATKSVALTGTSASALAVIDPGSSSGATGTLSITAPAGVAFNNFSRLAIDLAGSGSAADKLAVTGNVTLSSGANGTSLAISGTPDGTVAKYVLLSATGNLTGGFNSNSGVPSGYRLSVVTGAAGEVALVHQATVGFVADPANATVVRSGTTPTIGVRISNSAPTGSDAASYSIAAAGVTTLNGATGTRAADGASGFDTKSGTYTAVTGVNSKTVSISNTGANSWNNAPSNVIITQNAYDYANPTFSGGGITVNAGSASSPFPAFNTNYSLNFGSFTVGSGTQTLGLTLTNTLITNASFQDALNGSYVMSGSGAFAGWSSFSDINANAFTSPLNITFDTSGTLGLYTGTLTFTPVSKNGAGLGNTNMTNIVISLSGTVTAPATPAAFDFVTPSVTVNALKGAAGGSVSTNVTVFNSGGAAGTATFSLGSTDANLTPNSPGGTIGSGANGTGSLLVNTTAYASGANTLNVTPAGTPSSINITYNVGNATAAEVPTLHDHATVGAGLSASVAAASSYGTLSSKVVVLDDEVGSEAILVGGTASNNTTVTMSWRERNADEVIGTYTNPPVQGAGVLISDVVQISGTGSDAYLLKVSYTWNPLDFGGVSESTAIANGWIRLMYLDPVTGGLNDGSGVNDDQWRFAAETTGGLFNYMGDHSPVLADGVGSFGVDTSGATHYAWAILDHGGQYAVVPEPSSVALLGLGAMGLLKRRRR